MSEFLIESHSDTLEQILRAMCDENVAAEQIEKQIKQFNQDCISLSHQDLSKVFQQLDDDKIDFRNNDTVIGFFY